MGLTLCIAEFAVVSQAHDNRASELRTALIERGCPLSLGRNLFCNDVTLRHGQQNTTCRGDDVSNRHSKTVQFPHSHKSANTRPGMAHCSGARTSRRPSLKSLMRPAPVVSPKNSLPHGRSPSFIFPKSTQADCWRARDDVAHRNPSNLFDRLQ